MFWPRKFIVRNISVLVFILVFENVMYHLIRFLLILNFCRFF